MNNFIRKNKLIIAISLLALFLRLYNISGHGMITDELTWMVNSKELFRAIRAQNFTIFEYGWWTDKADVRAISLPNTFISGFLYYFTVKGQSKYSPGIFSEIVAVRIPSAIIGALFIPTFYFLIKKHVGEKISIIAVSLLAFDPISIGLSRYLKQDSTLMVTSFLAVFFYIYSPKWKYLVLSALFTSLAFLTKPQALLIPSVLLLYSLMFSQSRKYHFFLNYFKYLAISILFTVILFPHFWHNPLFRFLDYLNTQFLISSTQGRLTFFQGQITENPPWYYYLVTTPYHLLEPILIGLILVIMSLISKMKDKTIKIPIWITVSITYCLLYLSIVSISSIKLGTPYIYPIWPYIFIFASYGLLWLSKKLPQKLRPIYWMLVFAFPIVAIFRFTPSYHLYYNFLTSPANFQNRETIAFCDGVKPSIEYIAPKLSHGINLKIPFCFPVAQYYTSFGLRESFKFSENPKYIILDNSVSQLLPKLESEILANHYKLEKEVTFQGLSLAKIYSPQKLK